MWFGIIQQHFKEHVGAAQWAAYDQLCKQECDADQLTKTIAQVTALIRGYVVAGYPEVSLENHEAHFIPRGLLRYALEIIHLRLRQRLRLDTDEEVSHKALASFRLMERIAQRKVDPVSFEILEPSSDAPKKVKLLTVQQLPEHCTIAFLDDGKVDRIHKVVAMCLSGQTLAYIDARGTSEGVVVVHSIKELHQVGALWRGKNGYWRTFTNETRVDIPSEWKAEPELPGEAALQAEVERRRNDPKTSHTFPFPVTFRALGEGTEEEAEELPVWPAGTNHPAIRPVGLAWHLGFDVQATLQFIKKHLGDAGFAKYQVSVHGCFGAIQLGSRVVQRGKWLVIAGDELHVETELPTSHKWQLASMTYESRWAMADVAGPSGYKWLKPGELAIPITGTVANGDAVIRFSQGLVRRLDDTSLQLIIPEERDSCWSHRLLHVGEYLVLDEHARFSIRKVVPACSATWRDPASIPAPEPKRDV